MNFRIIWGTLWLLTIAILGCGPRVRVKIDPEAGSLVPRESWCQIDVYREADPIRGNFREIGTISLGDTAFTVDCGRDSMMKHLRRRACAAGADAVRVSRVRGADFASTCVRIDAILLKRDGGGDK